MSYDDNSFSSMCADANRIAAQLRGRQPLTKEIRLSKPKVRAVRAPATGIAGKGGYLRVAKEARVQEVLAYCREFFAENDQIPPQSCIAQRFDVFEQTAQTYMHALRDAGHVERNAVGKWRFARGAR